MHTQMLVGRFGEMIYIHVYIHTYIHTQMLAGRFGEMISTLVSFHGEPLRMEEQIVWLAFRHIRYVRCVSM
jgi:hypothetical protein